MTRRMNRMTAGIMAELMAGMMALMIDSDGSDKLVENRMNGENK